jgi:hypothetical protein
MTSSLKDASPPSPSASFYAFSDDEEGEYNTITQTSTGRGVKLLYSKSKVRGFLFHVHTDFASISY